GCREVSLEVLTKPYYITSSGYVLRNMIVVKNGTSWFPVFMMVFDTKKRTYQFNLISNDSDKKHTVKEKIGIHTKVHDNLNKKKGYVRKVIDYYNDGLPSVVEIEWEDKTAEVQSVIHPKDEAIKESIIFICPFCNAELDKKVTNECSSCGSTLWISSSSIPRIATKIPLQKPNFVVKCVHKEELIVKGKSKYEEIPNYNWGASPAARKRVVGDMLTKIRICDIPQPFFARFLKVLIKERELSIKKLIDIFGENYKHTVPHWLREDLGGSPPKPKDLDTLEEVFGSTEWFSLLKLTALKIQTVKPSINGKMPEDFLDSKDMTIFLKLFKS
ncbi:MAG: hypothetical protein N2648_05240, partial [Aquificaceae bacterium]|nr:hypothetical protein [Aquificaceae bacterium]